MSDPVVIDLSHWNTVTDFVAVRASGVLGVIHKATEGASYVDSTYHGRMERARDAGLMWGAYHFMRPEYAAGDQMQHFLDTAGLPDGALIALDYEAEGLDLDMLHDCLDWLSLHAPGMQICIYGGALLKEQLGDDENEDFAQTSLWLAQYTTGTPSWPSATWPAWTLWQYTDKASVPGIAEPCDGNRFNGSDENLIKWFGAPLPEPEPEPEKPKVTVSIEAPKGVKVGVIVNGKVIK